MDPVASILLNYPRVYFACHARHRRDPGSSRVITERLATILDHLELDTTQTLGELADHMGVTPATMSIAVGRLVDGGWVRRDRDPLDARRVQLRLTKSGARMKAAQTVLEPSRVAQVLKRLTPGETEAAVRGLALLARAATDEVASWNKGED